MKTIPALVILILGIGCTASTDPGKDYASLQNKLNENRNLWINQGFRHYQFDFLLGAFSPYAGIWYTVEVNQGQVISVVATETQTAVDPVLFAWIKSIDGDFDQLQSAISQKAHAISATFNADHGFIEYYYIDYVANVADDEISIRAKNFVIL